MIQTQCEFYGNRIQRSELRSLSREGGRKGRRQIPMRSRKILVFLFCSIAVILATLSAQEVLDAVKAGDLAKVKVLVEKDPKIVNEKAQNGMTVPFAAVMNRRFEITG